ncbi:MAG: type II toxin-antitoxin system VapC family toxin [Candidatus Rokuibacteriota bacterium]
MYLDTAILVKLLVREPDSDFYAGLVDGQPAWSSHVVLVECLSALLRKERERAIDRSHRRRAWRQVVADVDALRLNLVAVTPSLLERAAAILNVCHPDVALRSLDAIHLASAERCQSWPLCSNDVRMRAAAARLGLPLAAIPGRTT